MCAAAGGAAVVSRSFREYSQNKCRSCTIKIDMNVYFIECVLNSGVEREVNETEKKPFRER